MTPERRKEVVALLKSLSHRESPVNNGMLSAYDDGATSGWAIEEAQARSMALREAADALESASTCGFCGREVHADLKPMCGDCAGKEDPATMVLRADLAKANAEVQRLLALTRCPCGRNGGVVWCETCDGLAKAKERIATLETVIRERDARIVGMRKAMNDRGDR